MVVKTAAQFKKEAEDAARNLPIETKKRFWAAMIREGKNLGEASQMVGIKDTSVAAELVIQCHKLTYIPLSVDEIK